MPLFTLDQGMLTFFLRVARDGRLEYLPFPLRQFFATITASQEVTASHASLPPRTMVWNRPRREGSHPPITSRRTGRCSAQAGLPYLGPNLVNEVKLF